MLLFSLWPVSLLLFKFGAMILILLHNLTAEATTPTDMSELKEPNNQNHVYRNALLSPKALDSQLPTQHLMGKHLVSEIGKNGNDSWQSLRDRRQRDTSDRMPSMDECIADQYNYSTLKGCLCYLFQSNGLDSGKFHTPPLEFQRDHETRGLQCMLFTFVGDVNEIVRVELTYFAQMMTDKQPSRQSTLNTGCTSQVRIFPDLDRAELNQNDVEFAKLCAQDQLDSIHSTDIKRYYSSGRVLILELQMKQPVNLSGIYRFEDKDWYRNDGFPVSGTAHDWLFLSPQLQLSASTIATIASGISPPIGQLPDKEWRGNGQFFSPEFPRDFVAGLQFVYFFRGHPTERVVLSMYQVKLPGSTMCTEKDIKSDHITLFEFPNSVQVTPVNWHTTVGKHKRKVVTQLCSTTAAIQVTSDSSNLALQFTAGPFHANNTCSFKGRFRFVPKENAIPTWSLPDTSGAVDSGSAQSEQSYGMPDDQPTVQHIWMDKTRPAGRISSPGYPHAYPPNVKLDYLFHIPQRMRLHLKFIDFYLGTEEPKHCKHSSRDRLEIYDGSPGPLESPSAVLCGNRLPTDLIRSHFTSGHLISQGRTLMLRFITDAVTLPVGVERGFLATYTFQSANNDALENEWRPVGAFSNVDASMDGQRSKLSDDCSYVITSKGKDIYGRLPVPRYLPINAPNGMKQVTEQPQHQAEKRNRTCRWQLRGQSGQRIQLRLRKPPPRLNRADPIRHRLISPVQHDEEIRLDSQRRDEPLYAPYRTNPSPFSSPNPTLIMRSFRCQTPLSLELIDYRPRVGSGLHTNNYQNMSTDIDARLFNEDSSARRNALPSDPVRICAGSSATDSPAARGFMSGHVPQLDIVLRMDAPTDGDGSEKLLTAIGSISGQDYVDLGYDVEYKFVTDYGVTAPFGYQRKPGCFFEFNRSTANKGNFSSPNYPGLYPIDLVCEYRFRGSDVEKIEIEFIEFDVESASKTCSDDRLGDYVEIRSCYSVELIHYPKRRRLCQQPASDAKFHIEWYEPCLILRFFSNEMFVANGFFGIYKFHTSGQAPLEPLWQLQMLLILLIVVVRYLGDELCNWASY